MPGIFKNDFMYQTGFWRVSDVPECGYSTGGWKKNRHSAEYAKKAHSEGSSKYA